MPDITGSPVSAPDSHPIHQSHLSLDIMQAMRSHSSAASTPDTLEGSASTPSPMSFRSSASSMALSPISPQLQSPLLSSPPEIIQRILWNSGTGDIPTISKVAKTCRNLRSFIYDTPDQALWRNIHLRTYDDPRRAGAFTKPRDVGSWKKQVQDREFVGRIFREWNEDRYEELADHLDIIIETLMAMYLDLPASNDALNSVSKKAVPTNPLAEEDTLNEPLLVSIIRSEAFQFIYYNLGKRETKPLLRPLRSQPGNPNRRVLRETTHPDLSRLHALLSPDFSDADDTHRAQRGYLREVVYTASNFQYRNDWGPFTEEGKVWWPAVDAIGSVMMANARDVLGQGEDGWRSAVLPVSFGLEPVRGWGFNDLRRPPDLEKDEVWDWAGVEGPWCGSYAFVDYADWLRLNEPTMAELRHPSNHLDLCYYNEAVGDLNHLTLVIDKDAETSNKAAQDAHSSEPVHTVGTHLPTSDLLPPIYFHGASIQREGHVTFPSHSPRSFIRGVVQLTADDPPQVRWTFVIRYGGADRWRLEGVQVGGRGSKRGFFGIWTDALKEDHSPNGPVWYWKPTL